jgi:hypothetical protein
MIAGFKHDHNGFQQSTRMHAAGCAGGDRDNRAGLRRAIRE